jgi:multiple sugar transport system ATP-binding protein
MAKLVVENLTKRFGRVVAVDNLSFQAEDGEFLVLIGPSGCGKSTTLNLIAGLEDITSGNILIGGKRVKRLHPKDRDIAMVFQNYALYPHMNVYRNMAFGLSMRGFDRGEIETRIHEAAEILGIQDLLHRKPKELSGGQRQRVAVGRAIVRKPAVFLFDEPLSNLDAKLRVQMRAELTKLHRKLNTTIVYVTHDQVEAMTMATRIVLLKDGLCQQIGNPMELYNQPVNTFVAGFIGTPPMNIIEARIESGESCVQVTCDCFRVSVPRTLQPFFDAVKDREVLFGIRPENVSAATAVKGPDEENTVSVSLVVDIVETLGSHLQIALKCGRDRLIATADPNAAIRHGDKIPVKLQMDKMHVFEKDPPHLRIPIMSHPKQR